MLPFSLLNFSRINVKSSSKILYRPESAHSNACTIRYTLAVVHPLHTTHSTPPSPIKLYMYIRCMHDYHMLTSPDMNGELWKTRHSRVGLQCHTTERQSLAAEAHAYTESHTYTIHDLWHALVHTQTHMHIGTRHSRYRTREECTSTRTTSTFNLNPENHCCWKTKISSLRHKSICHHTHRQ